jgi:hypothetical protein
MKRAPFLLTFITLAMGLGFSQPAFSVPDNMVSMGISYAPDTWKAESSYYQQTFTTSDTWNLLNITLNYSEKYFQLSAGYITSVSGAWKWADSYSATSGSGKITASRTFLSFRGLLKYPFQAGSLRLFPLAGIGYDMNLTWKDENGKDLKATYSNTTVEGLSRLFLQVGAGMAFQVDDLILCPELILGIKLATQDDKDYENYMTKVKNWSSSEVTETKVDIGLLIGYPL